MQNTQKKGVIIVNPYGKQNLSLAQAERIKNEFAFLGLETPIIKIDELGYIIDKDKISSKFSGASSVTFVPFDMQNAFLAETLPLTLK